MTISAHHAGVQLLNQAQGMANSAARNIHDASLPAAQSANSGASTNPGASANSGASSNTRALANPAMSQTSAAEHSASGQRPDPVNAAVDLLQAKLYNQAGANVLQRSNEMTGTLLNTKV
ncbi:hypothetical protein [Photobacterium sp. TY1-4]|uniref:hypothetical protein n=1 Tax=Photobacterium sp. TY1-4 TaxID=2899122 RepID=UPI0021C0E59A|nr:hypothetical protein [Photobacterium sp. TY1-4]UXI03152.1 hypothetical protein NH461_22185 [Photobacterium sp. TY1-4]